MRDTGNQRKIGIIISYATLMVQLLITFLFTPYILKALGQEQYGLYQLVGSTVSYLSLFGLGFSASYIRFYSRYATTGEEDKISNLNGFFIIIFMTMALACLAIGFLLVFNIDHVYGKGIDKSQYKTAKIIMSIQVINMSMTFPKSIFVCNTTAHERFIFQKLVTLLHSVLNPLFQITFLCFGMQSIGLALSALFASVIDFSINVIFNLRQLHIRFSLKKVETSLLKEISTFTLFIFINQVMDLLSDSSIDTYLIGRIKGTAEVTIYSIGYKFVQIFYSVASPISAVFIPLVNRIVTVNNDNKKLTDIFVRVGKIQYMVLLFIFSGFVIWGKEFIFFWIDDGYKGAYIVAVLNMLSLIIALSQNIGIEIQRAKNKHQVRSVVYFCIAICNVIISIPLIQRYGAIGATIGTMISLILGTVLFMNIYYFLVLKIDIRKFWMNIIIITCKVLPCFLFGIFIKKYLGCNSIIQLVIEILLYSVMYIFICYKFGLNEFEKKSLRVHYINHL